MKRLPHYHVKFDADSGYWLVLQRTNGDGPDRSIASYQNRNDARKAAKLFNEIPTNPEPQGPFHPSGDPGADRGDQDQNENEKYRVASG